MTNTSRLKSDDDIKRDQDAIFSGNRGKMWPIFKKRIEEAGRRRLPVTLEMRESEALYGGRSYVRYKRNEQRLVEDVKSRDKGFFLPVVPSAVMSTVGRLGSMTLVPEGVPASTDPDDVTSAAITSYVLQAYYERLNTAKQNDVMAVLLMVLGNMFKAHYWDHAAYAQVVVDAADLRLFTEGTDKAIRSVSVLPGSGGRKLVIEAQVGDLKTDLCSPYTFYVQPGITELDSAWVFRGFYRPVSYIRRLASESQEGAIVPEYIASRHDVSAESYRSMIEPYSASHNVDDADIIPEDMQIGRLFEFFEPLPDGRYQRFLFNHYEEGVWLNKDEEPHDELPFVHYYALPSLDTFWHPSYVHLMKQPQRMIDYLITQVMYAVYRMPKAALIAPRGVKFATTDTDEHMMVFRHDGAFGQVTPMQLQAYNPELLALIDYIKNWIFNEIASQHAYTRSEPPQHSISGRAVEQLLSGDMSRFALMDRLIQESERLSYLKQLRLLKKHAGQRRLLRMVPTAERGMIMAQAFRANDLGNTEDVHLRTQSPLPRTLAERWNLVAQLFTGGWFNKERKEEREEAMRFLGAGSTLFGTENRDPNEDSAKIENEWIKNGSASVEQEDIEDPQSGQPMSVSRVVYRKTSAMPGEQDATPIFHEMQDHGVHFKTVLSEIQSPRFYDYPEDVRNAFFVHANEHKQQLDMLMQQAQQTQQPPQPGMPTGQGMPPGPEMTGPPPSGPPKGRAGPQPGAPPVPEGAMP